MSIPAYDTEAERQGLAWQRGIWDRYPQTYAREVDKRFAPVIEAVIRRAALTPGQRVLDLGTGTGSVALRAAALVGPDGQVLGVDISPEMLTVARQRATELNLSNIGWREGRAEAIPSDDGACDAMLASLSLMYAIDRATAAREIANSVPQDRRGAGQGALSLAKSTRMMYMYGA